MTIEIRNLGDQWSWGSRVRGVNAGNVQDEGLRAELQQLFRDRGVIVFEDMDPTPEMQVGLSTVFGPLKDHPTKSVPPAEAGLAEGVIDMHRPAEENEIHDHGLVGIGGRKVKSFLPWHF